MNYIFYSGATRLTGEALAERLGMSPTTEQPTSAEKLIGWGCKTNQDLDFTNTVIINHPNKIRSNRNKLESLRTLASNEDTSNYVAKFSEAESVIDAIDHDRLTLPVIGRKRMHQGGKGFWFCVTKNMVTKAIAEGAQYFQEFLHIEREYRIHVFQNRAIYTQIKNEKSDKEYWKSLHKDKITKYAANNNISLDDSTIDVVLDRMAREETLPNTLIRSNTRGWIFNHVALSDTDAKVVAAVNAVRAVGLDFGAVDLAIDSNNNIYIIEINSGPGLKGAVLDAYVEAFSAWLEENTPSSSTANNSASSNRPSNDHVNNNSSQPNNTININDNSLMLMLNAVSSPEEARALLNRLFNNT